MEKEADIETEVDLEMEEDLAVEEEMEIKDDMETEMLIVIQGIILVTDIIILETEDKTSKVILETVETVVTEIGKAILEVERIMQEMEGTEMVKLETGTETSITPRKATGR